MHRMEGYASKGGLRAADTDSHVAPADARRDTMGRPASV